MPKAITKRHIRKRANQEVNALFEHFALPGTSSNFLSPTTSDSGHLSCESRAGNSSRLRVPNTASSDSADETTESICHSRYDHEEFAELPRGADSEARISSSEIIIETAVGREGGTSGEEVSDTPEGFAALLAKWAVEQGVTHMSLTSLLGLLKSHHCFSDLPSDARTLLHTPRNTAKVAGITSLPPGQYCHFGIVSGLKRILLWRLPSPQSVTISLNVNGLPLPKSSREQLWPIQCLVQDTGCTKQDAPFLVGAFVGHSKPGCANSFLEPLVAELKEVLDKGISVSGKTISVTVKGIICDAPARAFIFKTKGHTGYSGCPKCTVEGSFGAKMHFPTTVATPRTDHSFRSQVDSDHHLGTSVLTNLPIDCIKCVPLDPMHLVYLGVTRKLVNL
ncbi:unnamed protein product [Ixodes persulcatus]